MSEPVQDFDPVLLAQGWAPMEHHPRNEELEAHYARFFGPPVMVGHEMLSKHMHLDINVWPPTADRPFTIYATSGMSDLPRPLELADGPAEIFAELIVALPGPPESHGDHYLVRRLTHFARYVHADQTWLGFHHTIGGERDPPLGPDTRMNGLFLCGAHIIVPAASRRDFITFTNAAGEFTILLCLVPVHADEIALKLAQGGEALEDRLVGAGVTELYDPRRPSICGRPGMLSAWKRWFQR